MDDKWNNIENMANPGLMGIKPYAPGKSIMEVAREKGIDNIIKMASNENPLGPSPGAIVALEKKLHTIFQYPEVTSTELREALSKKFGVPGECFITGNGADGVINYLIVTLTGEADEVIIPRNTFPVYETATRFMRGKIIFSEMKDNGIDLDDMLAKIGPKTKMVWICNPNNPTGTLIEEKALCDFIKKVPEEVLIVHDEVYRDFVPSGCFPDTVKLFLEGQKNLFLIRSFSKVYGLAGLRIGYGIGDPELINMIYRIRPPFDVSVLAETAARGALEDDAFYKKTLELTADGKLFLYKELEIMGLSYIPSYTNFIMIDLGRDCMPVFERLLDEGIIVRPARSYGYPHFIRVTVGTEEWNTRFVGALKKVLGK